MVDRRGFLGALLAAPAFAARPQGTSCETLGPDQEHFLTLVKRTLLRGDAYEHEYRIQTDPIYKAQGITWSGLERVSTSTGDANWTYKFIAERRKK